MSSLCGRVEANLGYFNISISAFDLMVFKLMVGKMVSQSDYDQ